MREKEGEVSEAARRCCGEQENYSCCWWCGVCLGPWVGALPVRDARQECHPFPPSHPGRPRHITELIDVNSTNRMAVLHSGFPQNLRAVLSADTEQHT